MQGWRNTLAVWSRIALFLAVLIVPAMPAMADDREVAIDPEVLTALVAEMQRSYGVPGLIVGIQSGDEAPLIIAAGTSLPGLPATPDMHFRIGAISITTLTTILMQLVDEGVLALDTPLSNWYLDYPDAGQVTVGMVAGSRSGYQDYVRDEGFIDAFYDDVFAVWTADELKTITFDMGMAFDPGEGFAYSHANFIILGEVLEQATVKRLRELVETRVVDPLGLQALQYRDDAALSHPVLHAYTDERGVFENSTYWSPSWTSHTGFFTSDMADMLVLWRALASGQLLSPQGFATLTTPINVGDAFNRPDFHYAYGILVNEPWISQSFSFGGYDGIASHHGEKDLTIGVIDTLGEGLESGPSREILAEVQAALGLADAKP
jgi:D-alanyl-D-alanine carboxypeptidase